MLIREKGNRIQCFRTTYDPTKKRGVDKMLGSMSKFESKAPKELLESLTDDEKLELETFLENKEALKAKEDAAFSVRLLHRHIENFRVAMEDEDARKELTEDGTRVIWAELDEARRTLRKYGFAKPKPEGK